MTDDEVDEWFARQGASTVDQFDAQLSVGVVRAMHVLLPATASNGRPTFGEIQGLAERRRFVLHAVDVREEQRGDLEAMEARLRSIGAPVRVIEALWDGDMYGWMVDLVAVVADGESGDARDVRLGSYRRAGGDLRLFNESAPTWPEVEWAREDGVALAARLHVPFWFAAPGGPDLDEPRWRAEVGGGSAE